MHIRFSLSSVSTYLRIAFSILFLLPGVAGAIAAGEAPVANATVIPAEIMESLDPDTIHIPIPPRIFLTGIETDQLTVVVSGTAVPGSVNATIESILWDWGDNTTPEYHAFPHSHTYDETGTYTLAVSAFQSDGLTATRTKSISIVRQILPDITVGIVSTTTPAQTAGPAMVPGAPVLTLLEPVMDGMNVTVNGNLNAGGPGVTISSVIIDWDDGNLTESPDLPATHRYSVAAIYTVNITGLQSDGQLTTKGITVNVREDAAGPPGPAASASPPAEPLPVLYIVLGTAIAVGVFVLVLQQIVHRKRGSSGLPDIPEPIAEREEQYYRAKERGDMTEAADHARAVSRMFRSLAGQIPAKRIFCLEMAETWEMKAQNAERTGLKEQRMPKPGGLAENLPPWTTLERICSGTDVGPDILGAVLRIALEIAAEGREGKAVGTSFVIGDSAAVLNNSRQFVLNPFQGHTEAERQITDAGIRGNIKEFAQLDGAFIVSGNGSVEAAGRYITVDMSGVTLTNGLGSRHSSIAGITRATSSIGVVVSQSGGIITIFRDGQIVATIGS